MGKYNANNGKQDISGIATLTNNPIALDNIRKIRIGDRVMCNEDGNSGKVLDVDTDGFGCIVLFDNTEETYIECEQLSKE